MEKDERFQYNFGYLPLSSSTRRNTDGSDFPNLNIVPGIWEGGMSVLATFTIIH